MNMRRRKRCEQEQGKKARECVATRIKSLNRTRKNNVGIRKHREEQVLEQDQDEAELLCDKTQQGGIYERKEKIKEICLKVGHEKRTRTKQEVKREKTTRKNKLKKGIRKNKDNNKK